MLNLEATFLLPQSQHIHIFIANQGNMILEVIVSQRRIVEFFFSFYHRTTSEAPISPDSGL